MPMPFSTFSKTRTMAPTPSRLTNIRLAAAACLLSGLLPAQAFLQAQAPAVTGIELLNADTDVPVSTLTDGDTIDLSQTGPHLALQALANGSTGSVVFALSGEQSANATESNAPFALFGDAAGDFNSWEPALGAYSLTATAWSGSSGSGTPGPGVSISFTVVDGAAGDPGAWSYIWPGTNPTARHECSFVQAGDQFLLMGGRGIKPVDAYDLNTESWSPLNPTPQEIHHFQATSFHGLVYIIGAFEGNFPFENGIPFIYIYDPLTDTWYDGPDIPTARIRGSAGLVLHNDVFYVVAGITNGHTDGWVPWLDAFDPLTNSWTQLADAPRARDHFHAAVLDNKLYCAGGRRSGEGGSTFNAVVLPTDVYDFATGTWSTLPSPAGDIPTGRAGCMTGVLGGELIVFGGESGSQTAAHDEAEALDPATGTWRSLDALNRGRHGSQAIVSGNGIYVAAGSGNRGGSPELNSFEEFHFGTPTPPSSTALTAGNLSAAPLDLTASVGDTLTGDVDIDHISGNQAVLVHEAYLEGHPAFQLPVLPSTPFAIAPGVSRGLELRYAPSTPGLAEAELVLVYGAFADTLRVPLSGNASNCDASSAPDGLSSVIGASQVSFSWNPVPGAVACELQGGVSGGPTAKLRFPVAPHSISVPSGKFLPSTTYGWRVRCACSTSPVLATPFSDLAFFTTPSAKAGGYSPNASGFGVVPSMELHPSPATEHVTLQWHAWDGRASLRMLDATGRTVLQEAVDAGTGQYRMERGSWPAGIYWLELKQLDAATGPALHIRQAVVWE